MNAFYKKWLSIVGYLSIIFLSNPLWALKTGGHVQATLVSEVKNIQPGTPFTLAVRLDMQKDWHTYWVNPAESGAPTKITWDLPPGWKADAIQWPYPKKIVVPPVVTYGYENEAWLLTTIVPSKDTPLEKNRTIRAKIDWLECSVECIPGAADVQITLPVTRESAKADPGMAEAFSKARMALPLRNTDWVLSAISHNKQIQISLTPPTWYKNRITEIDFFSSDRDVIDYPTLPRLEKKDSDYILTLTMSETASPPIKELNGVVVVEPGLRGPNSEKALELKLPVQQSNSLSTPKEGFLWPFLLAFLGGLLLNLMPCVLPVLSLKVLNFIKTGQDSSSRPFAASLIFASGVVLSFWLLAGLLIFLRSSGQQLGWGFQMQSPPFVIFLLSLFYLLSLNLFGVFEIGTSFIQLGDVSSNKKGHWGSFLSGALTTLVATPCTAPFMGSALGYAITQPAYVSMGIFTFLGLGVAAPYVLLSAFPQLLRFLPKPGEWMNTLKKILAILMMGTVAWLIWVLSKQKSMIFFPLGVLLGLLSVIAVLLRSISSRKRIFGLIFLLGSMGGSIFWVTTLPTAEQNVENVHSKIQWEPFSMDRVAQLQLEGRPVFVDFTARWCLTCQVNERVALNNNDVIQKIKEKKVAMLKADWTSYDAEITKTLEKFGRNGVPFYLLYSSNNQEQPKTLPEILTPGIVLSALEKIN